MTVPIYICPDALPHSTDTPEEWVQRVTLLAQQIDTMAGQLFNYLRVNAPMLLTADGLNAAHLLAGIGFTAQGIAKTGAEVLTAAGKAVLDPVEEQKRLIRDQLDNPNCPAELREDLLGMLAMALQEDSAPVEQPPAEDEWPADGVVIGGE